MSISSQTITIIIYILFIKSVLIMVVTLKVIPPSLFEIHACNKYKRAVQYIFLQNGRSLIHILKACKSTRLNTLEATVQNAIGPLPEKKIIVCQNCKGELPFCSTP